MCSSRIHGETKWKIARSKCTSGTESVHLALVLRHLEAPARRQTEQNSARQEELNKSHEQMQKKTSGDMHHCFIPRWNVIPLETSYFTTRQASLTETLKNLTQKPFHSFFAKASIYVCRDSTAANLTLSQTFSNFNQTSQINKNWKAAKV